MRQCTRRVSFIAILVALLTVFAVPAAAGKVKISGTAAAVFDQTTGSFTFTGPVTITDGKTIITGEFVTYQGEAEVLQFRGPVTIEQDGNTLKGYDLRYDVKKSEGSVDKALGSLTPAGATSAVHVIGDKVTTCQERTVLSGARLTTCNPEDPGYYLASRTIEIYPGDKMVLYGVRFVESGLTLFYWPRVTFSLKRADPDQASESVVLPKIGYSSTEGWFIKSSYGYRGPGLQRGRILLDYMQLLGWGYGILHTLRSDSTAKEEFYAYAQPNRDTEHTDVEISFDELRTLPGNIRLIGRSAYETSYTTDEQTEFSNQISLSQDRRGGNTSLSYTDKRLSGPIDGYDIVGAANHSQDLGHKWKLRINATLNRRDRTDMIDRNLVGYVTELRRDTSDWSLGLVAEDKFNPDLDDDTPPEVMWNRAQRLPEFTLRINRLSLAGWDTPFEIDGAWGRLTENRRFGEVGNEGTQRTHIAAKVKPLQLSLGSLGHLQWSGSATRRAYSTGERQWVAGAQSNYRLQVSKTLAFSADYRYEQAFGDASPFYFDRVVDNEEVQTRVEYNTGPMQISLSGGYDLMDAEPLDVVGSVRIQPSDKLKLQAQGAYSLVDANWSYVIGTGQYTPDDHFTLNLGAKYNVPLQRADRVDAVIKWDLGGWEIGYTGIWDGIDKEFDQGDFRITRDLDCRAIDLRYNQSRKEVWLEYRITAFPAASLKFGATDQHFMFDAKGWEEVLATE